MPQNHSTLLGFLIGLGFFLLGMNFLETGLARISGTKLKRIIQKQTRTTLKSMWVGTVSTAILQSSSLVSLLTLAFVGAEVLSLKSALGIVFGANLGTTLKGWLVAGLGFKVDLDQAALPMIALGAMAMTLANRERKFFQIWSLIVGLGFLLSGLANMKASVEGFSQSFDVSMVQGQSLLIYAIAGFIFTAIIHSSSATMMIALSALNSELVSIHEAAALVIGADLGTTLTAFLGAIGGVPAKKRLALGQFLFNLGIDSLAFVLLVPWLKGLQQVLAISDPLYLLVSFHSSFNLLGLVLFLPITGQFASFLERRFQKKNDRPTHFIHLVPTPVPEASLAAMTREAEQFLKDVGQLMTHYMSFERKEQDDWLAFLKAYDRLKACEGDMLAYAQELQKGTLDGSETQRLTHLVNSARLAINSAKSLKNIWHNLASFAADPNRPASQAVETFLKRDHQVWQNMTAVLEISGNWFERLAQLKKELDQSVLQPTLDFARLPESELGETDLSSLLNVNHELNLGLQAFLGALKEFGLKPDQVSDFESLPVMI